MTPCYCAVTYKILFLQYSCKGVPYIYIRCSVCFHQSSFLSGYCLHPEHSKSLIYLIHTHGFLTLLRFTHKAESRTLAKGKFLLCQSCFFSFSFNKFSNSIHSIIIYPNGYNANRFFCTLYPLGTFLCICISDIIYPHLQGIAPR